MKRQYLSLRSRFIRWGLVGLVGLALGLGFVPMANAQYFGRNKVQYKKFDFKILKTQHFDLYFYPDEEEQAQQAGRLAERWYSRFARFLNHNLRGRQALVLYASSPEFQQTTVLPGIIGEGTGGVTEGSKRRIILPFGISLAETDHVIGHELVHAFQYDMTSLGGPQGAGGGQDLRIPLWFIEGLAEYLSIGPIDPHTSMWMRDAIRKKEFPTVKKLDDPRYFPYRWGQALWSYVGGRWGDEAVSRIMNAVGRLADYEVAMEKILKINLKQLGTDWEAATKAAYGPLISPEDLQAPPTTKTPPSAKTQNPSSTKMSTPPPPTSPPPSTSQASPPPPSSAGLTQIIDKSSRVLIKGSEEGAYNISPALSPDGKSLIFFSTRDLFSIELYEADAESGKVFRKLTQTAVDPHFESIQFISSTGAWDSEGKRYLFGAVSEGRPVLTIFNIAEKKAEKDIPFPGLGEIFNPTWSPDGKRVAFSALNGGITDLFIYDLDSKNLRQMTNDAFADIHPAWSPDGHDIAFVTDRYTTDLSILSAGNYELALMDPNSGEIRRAGGFPNAKNINPQWSPDSKSLYFLSDQSGISNIFRIDLESQNIFQVTNLYTGVSGITAHSPAFSVAQKEGRLVYSGYLGGKYEIYSIDAAEALTGKAPVVQFGQLKPSVLPPTQRVASSVLGLLRNPIFGLPEKTKFEIASYRPKLQLDYASTPSVGVGVDRYGTYAGGGVTLYWSDMLGQHTLATMAQVNGRIKDSAALVGYINSQHRINWGVVAQRIPYLYGGFGAYYDYSGQAYGEPAYIEQEIIYRQINYEVSGFASYPFSQVRRVELSAGYQYIGFDNEVFTRAVSLVRDAYLANGYESLPSPPGLHWASVSGALVYDSGYFGATGPILGQSYVVEASPQIGSINFTNFMADYRKYYMPVRPFTLAFRFLHYGRYGSGAEDNRLWPLYIGYDGLVRGYDFNSIGASEYADPTSSNYFDYRRLMGSKMMIANFELRFPLFGALGIGRGYYGVFPVDFIAFFDSGLAWYDKTPADMLNPLNPDPKKERAWFLSGGMRKPLSSTGVGLRINVLGYLIVGVNYVYPLNRPGKGGYFQFSFVPGF